MPDPKSSYVPGSVSAWGWIHLILGVLLMLGGIGMTVLTIMWDVVPLFWILGVAFGLFQVLVGKDLRKLRDWSYAGHLLIGVICVLASLAMGWAQWPNLFWVAVWGLPGLVFGLLVITFAYMPGFRRGFEGSDRPLRVALVWDDAVVEEQELKIPLPVTLGSSSNALFPIPAEVAPDEEMLVLDPEGEVYTLRLGSGMQGSVWLNGERKDVGQLASQQSSVRIGPRDYGLLQLGGVSLFFQHVRGARRMARPVWFSMDPELAAGLGLSAFLFAAVLMIAFLDQRLHPVEDPLELPEDLVAKYMVVPPPEEVEEVTPESGTMEEEPGMRAREEMGGKKHEGEEGRVGHEDKQREDTHIQGEVTDRVQQKVRGMGLLGALSGGGESNAIAEALDAPTVSDILGGMGDAPTQIGRGSRGAGLRGTGGGGGGDGPGALFGAGDMGTGIGAGGGGMGSGSGGPGVKGRKAKERKISVSTGSPNTTGKCAKAPIQRTVSTNASAVRYCYQVEVQRQPNLRGRVEVTWRIKSSGAVSGVRVSRSTMNNARVEGCIARQVKRWRFPKPEEGECQVTYPFIFGIQGG